MQFDRWQIGRVRIVKVAEYDQLQLMPSGIFGNADDKVAAKHPWLTPDWALPSGELRMSIHSFIIESEGKAILVDACVGEGKTLNFPGFGNARSDFIERLAAAGYPVERIDFVLCTHLHFDHVGWNTRLIDGRWAPTFANARYLFARAEWEHWRAADEIKHGNVLAESLAPVIEGGRADIVAMDHRITAEVRLEPTPGHTPGHVSVKIESAGESAVITGDLCHHPVQFAEPQFSSNADDDSAAAERTRRDFLRRHADRPVLVLGTHFTSPTGGHVKSDGAAWRFHGKR